MYKYVIPELPIALPLTVARFTNHLWLQVVVSSVTLSDWSTLLQSIKSEVQKFPLRAGWGVSGAVSGDDTLADRAAPGSRFFGSGKGSSSSFVQALRCPFVKEFAHAGLGSVLCDFCVVF